MDAMLSFAQRRLWFLARMEGTSSNYNVHITLELRGDLDHGSLAQALADVVERHETLRTVFPEVDGEPVQRVLPSSEITVGLDVAELAEQDLADALTVDGRYEFDLTSQIPIRARLLVVEPARAVLSVVIHHIACDGWSMGPLIDDLALAYAARKLGQAPAYEELPVRYQDYTLWQHEVLGSEDDPHSLIHEQLEFWTETLAGLPEGIELPFDKLRPAESSYRGKSLDLLIPESVHRRLYDLVNQTQSSIYMVVQAALVAVLTRLGAGTDIVLGTAVAGRTDEALEDLIGFFVNTLVLRTDASGNPTFEQLIQRIRETDLSAFDNQDLPFERVVEAINPARASNRNPLFQVMYSLFNNNTAESSFADLTSQMRPIESDVAKFDLALSFNEEFSPDRSPAGISGKVQFALDLFEEATVRSLIDRLLRFLDAASQAPASRIGDIEIFSADELRQVTVDWNDTAQPLPAGTVPELIRARTLEQPDQVALVAADGSTVSYRQLDVRSDQIAIALAELGVVPEDRVAVMSPRSADLVATLLGILKAGATYVPLHEGYPPERMEWVLADSAATVLVTDSRTPRLADAPAPEQPISLRHQAKVLDVGTLPDGDGAAFEQRPVNPASLGYIMYTSGSTGTPKGVGVSHANMVALALDRCWDLHAGDRILLHSPYAFDISMHEIWVPLLGGAAIVVAPPGRLAPADFQRLIGEHRVSCVHVTAALFQLLAEEAPQSFEGLRQVWAGGDVVSSAAVGSLTARYPDLNVHHLYGPTETTLGVVSMIANGHAQDGVALPLGRPLDNVTAYVLDDRLRPVAAGCTGELYLGGAQVSRGYLNQPVQTATRFVADPFGTGGRLYRTGDLARWGSDGLLRFQGRTDDQVKIRGFRVELGEVEAAVAHASGVQQVLVLAREDRPGTKTLVAYLVGEIDQDQLRAALTASVPDYLVPSAFVSMDAFPLTPNGKVDRRKLPVPDYRTTEYEAGRNPREQLLCELFGEVLDVERVGINDNFFELGGHSLLATKLASRIRTVLNLEMSVRALFTTPTVAGLAASLVNQRPARPALRRMEPKVQ